MSCRLSSKWIFRPNNNSNAKIRLFCFPYAGSSSVISYKFLAESLPRTIDICLIELPGRGLRMSENPESSINPIVTGISREIKDYLDLPFIFFGHSMGALIAYELAYEIQHHYNQKPYKLYISSHRAPFSKKETKIMHKLEEREFKSELRQMNGIADEIWENEELLNIVLPIIKNDFKLCETYIYNARDKLNCEIVAFGGKNDPDVNEENLMEWNKITSNRFNIRLFEGNHFYFVNDKKKFTDIFYKYLEDDLRNIERK